MPADAFLSVQGIGKKYGGGGWRLPWLHRTMRAERPSHWAVRDVSFDLEKGRTLGIAGLSGSGKSTLARCLALFETPDSGEIRLAGSSLWPCPRRERAALRTRVQLIFQQPAATLNPRFTAEEIVAEPLVIQNRGTRAARGKRAAELMELAGLPAGSARKRALEFSGGERQRLAIARALALEPEVLILDESLSGLDLSVQAQIAALLHDLQQRLSLTYILISHDLELVSQMAGEVAIMDAGTVVEQGPAVAVCARPQHPRTRELLAAQWALTAGGAA
jgi:ABC-type glutathione transport system ATPase component